MLASIQKNKDPSWQGDDERAFGGRTMAAVGIRFASEIASS
jgi:hypothetical protein